jgi:hypothetical protein
MDPRDKPEDDRVERAATAAAYFSASLLFFTLSAST